MEDINANAKVVFVQTIKGAVHKYYDAYFGVDVRTPGIFEIHSCKTKDIIAFYPADSVCFISVVLPESNEHDVRE